MICSYISALWHRHFGERSSPSWMEGVSEMMPDSLSCGSIKSLEWDPAIFSIGNWIGATEWILGLNCWWSLKRIFVCCVTRIEVQSLFLYQRLLHWCMAKADELFFSVKWQLYTKEAKSLLHPKIILESRALRLVNLNHELVKKLIYKKINLISLSLCALICPIASCRAT